MLFSLVRNLLPDVSRRELRFIYGKLVHTDGFHGSTQEKSRNGCRKNAGQPVAFRLQVQSARGSSPRLRTVSPCRLKAGGISSGVMAGDPSSEGVPSAPQISAGFPATHWSVVLTAGHESSPGAREALEQLCRAYWYPLYCYVRRRIGCAADAEDLTQSFFAHLLERNTLAKVSREKGRFRSFLLAALNYFLANEWDKARTQKRGGGGVEVSLNEAGAEERYQRESGNELNPRSFKSQGRVSSASNRGKVWHSKSSPRRI